MKLVTIPVLCAAVLAACSTPVRFLPEAPAAEQRQRLRLNTLEVKDVQLPVYATEPEMLVEQADGSLVKSGKAVWADETAQAVTRGLVAALAIGSTAQVAAEPWPLAAYPDAQLVVRFDRFVPNVDGSFRASGQFAIASPDRRVRESISRFDLAVPVTAQTPQGLAAARAAMIRAVAAEVIRRLS